MNLELNLQFPTSNRVIVRLDERETEQMEFKSPLTEDALQEIRWYLEVYPVSYTTEVDDEKARSIESDLIQWGKALFEAVFHTRIAQRIFNDFQDEAIEGRLLTVSTKDSSILSLPWELLRDPEGTYLFHENPRISIRRKLTGGGSGRKFPQLPSKGKLRLLFVVSRPKDATFIDPRTDPMAVMDALKDEGVGGIEIEFLRPATLANLVKRLEDPREPKVDIVHFDGHGVFAPDGHLLSEALKSDPLVASKGEIKNGTNTGYLLFENDHGKTALISAETLGDMLNRQQISLMILSACQSAKVAGEEPMGSVAVRLIDAGIPAVLAMTHIVLLETTKQLFGEFYRGLVCGQGIGQALDNARRRLYLKQERGNWQRGKKRFTLKLQDWFLPVLYQNIADKPLLKAESEQISLTRQVVLKSNLPMLKEEGFFGRSQELWLIERAFVQGTRRITIAGFGGQGKTYLALEVGHWLCQTYMFEQACFVDYSSYQGVGADPVGFAINVISRTLDESFLDAEAVKLALEKRTTLIILDNLEVLETERLQELLETALAWSEAGNSRIILTTRMPRMPHSAYPSEASQKHLLIQLEGMKPQDVLAYFQKLLSLPPEPQFEMDQQEVLRVFKLVQFHPLSINLVVKELKKRQLTDVEQALKRLLQEIAITDRDKSLIASLKLSLERLDLDIQEHISMLGIFEGGAFEHLVSGITEIPNEKWLSIRNALEATGLIQIEYLGDLIYLRFHPTLAPVLWAKANQKVKDHLLIQYQKYYYEVSITLNRTLNTSRASLSNVFFQKELPNLLKAVYTSLKNEEFPAINFVENLRPYLQHFYLKRDLEILSQQVQKLGTLTGTRQWLVSRKTLASQLMDAGAFQDAEMVFRELISSIRDELIYDRCLVFSDFGRCLRDQGKWKEAIEVHQQGLKELSQLSTLGLREKILAIFPQDYFESYNDYFTFYNVDVSSRVTQDLDEARLTKLIDDLVAKIQVELAQVLTETGEYDEAKRIFEHFLAIDLEKGDWAGVSVLQLEIGTVACQQGNYEEAVQRILISLQIDRNLRDLKGEALCWQHLGVVFRVTKQWEPAEKAFREAARIRNLRGDSIDEALSYMELGSLNADRGKSLEAEAWYRKALEISKSCGDQASSFKIIYNLCVLLREQSDKFPEVVQLLSEIMIDELRAAQEKPNEA